MAAHSYVRYEGDGSTVGPYSITFPYIQKTHVTATVDGVDASFTWLSDTTVQMDTAPADGAILYIRRQTDRDNRLVDYTNGSMLSEEILDKDSKQAFYLVQEAYDNVNLSAGEDGILFSDKESILSALTGELDESHMVDKLGTDLSTMVDIYIDGAEIFTTEERVLEYGTVESPGGILQWSGYDVVEMETRIETNETNISLIAVDTTDLDTRVGVVEVDLDAAEADILLRATQAEVDGIETRLGVAEVDIDAAEASITQNVIDITAAEGDITYNAGQIALLANEYSVRLDANGYVAGFGLYNNGAGESEFIVNAAKFALVNESGTGKDYPFVVTGGVVYVDGDLLVTGSVDTQHLAADAVEADKINVSTLSAINSNIGTITAGVIQSANWSSTTGSYWQLSDGTLWLRSGDGLIVEQGGDIEIQGISGDPGTLSFRQNTSTIGTMDCSNTDALYFSGDDVNSTLNINQWYSIDIFGKGGGVDIRAQYDSNTTSYIWMDADSSDAYIRFGVRDGSSVYDYLYYDDTGLYPGSNKGIDLGNSSKAWDDFWFDDSNNVADFYWMDERTENGVTKRLDDIATIKAITPADKVDPLTGFRVINDSSIPTWLAVKHKEDGYVKDREEGSPTKGDIIQRWKRGDIAYNPEGKPYLSTKTMISLLMGAVRQLDEKIEELNRKEKADGCNCNPSR